MTIVLKTAHLWTVWRSWKRRQRRRNKSTIRLHYAVQLEYLSIHIVFMLSFNQSLICSGILCLFMSTENELAESLTRSKTMPTLGRPKLNRKLSTFNDGERLRMAKEMVEKAIKVSLRIDKLAVGNLLSQWIDRVISLQFVRVAPVASVRKLCSCHILGLSICLSVSLLFNQSG